MQQYQSLLFTQRNWNLRPQKNSHIDIYSSFIHNCQNLEAAKMSIQ